MCVPVQYSVPFSWHSLLCVCLHIVSHFSVHLPCSVVYLFTDICPHTCVLYSAHTVEPLCTSLHVSVCMLLRVSFCKCAALAFVMSLHTLFSLAHIAMAPCCSFLYTASPTSSRAFRCTPQHHHSAQFFPLLFSWQCCALPVCRGRCIPMDAWCLSSGAYTPLWVQHCGQGRAFSGHCTVVPCQVRMSPPLSTQNKYLPDNSLAVSSPTCTGETQPKAPPTQHLRQLQPTTQQVMPEAHTVVTQHSQTL